MQRVKNISFFLLLAQLHVTHVKINNTILHALKMCGTPPPPTIQMNFRTCLRFKISSYGTSAFDNWFLLPDVNIEVTLV